MTKRKISDYFRYPSARSTPGASTSATDSDSVSVTSSREFESEFDNEDTSSSQPSAQPTASPQPAAARQFKASWLQEFAWLRYDKEKQTMHCDFCAQAGQEIAGKTDFISGSSHFKKETVKKHGESRKHKNARDCMIAKSSPRATPMARAVSRACEKTAEKEFKELKIKFNAAYMIAVEEIPFTKFSSQILLMKKNGMDISKTYDNDTACAEFVGCIADELKDSTLEGAQKANYISVITDCGTDVSGRDNVITYCRHISAGVAVTRLVGLAELDHCHAQGTLNTIKTLLGNADQTNPDWWQDKMSAFGADGASVNMGAVGGVGALLRSEVGEHALSFHCLPHRLELAMLSTQRSVPMIEKVYDLLQLVWKTYHFSPKSKRELKAIAAELGCTVRTPSAVKTQRWLPHIYRALSVFLQANPATGQGQYMVVHHHMEHLAATSKNTDIKGRAKNIVQQMENLSFVGFCHFLHDLFSEVSKLSLTLQKNSLILPQAVAAIESCLVTVKGLKEKPLRDGKLQEFLQHTVSGQDSHAETAEQQEVQPASRRGRAASSSYSGITFQNIKLKSHQSHTTFRNYLNLLIEKTVDITVKELEKRFGNMMRSLEHGNSRGSEIIKCFSVFCHDAWPEDVVTFGEEEIDTLVNWYKYILTKNGCDVAAMQTEWRMLKILVKGQFMDKAYVGLWEVMLTKEPFCSDFKNILHLVEIMLVLPISAAQCERGFSAQNRIKSKVRNSLSVSTLEDLVRISTEGPSLELFDPEPSVKRWLSSSKRKRRPNYTGWPSDTDILMVGDTDAQSDE